MKEISAQHKENSPQEWRPSTGTGCPGGWEATILTGFRPLQVKALRGLTWLGKQPCLEQGDKPYLQRSLAPFFSPEIVNRITGFSFGSLFLIWIYF